MAKLLATDYVKANMLSNDSSFQGAVSMALLKAVREKLTGTVASGYYQSEEEQQSNMVAATIVLNNLDEQARKWVKVLASWDEYIVTVDCVEENGSLTFSNFNDAGSLDYTIRTVLWNTMSRV